MNADFLPYALPYINTILAILLGLGAFMSLRGGYSKHAGEIQEKVIAALKEQVETLEKQVENGEHEIIRLKQITLTIQYALKQRGLEMEIDGDTIIFSDRQSGRTRITPLRKPPDTQTTSQGNTDAVV